MPRPHPAWVKAGNEARELVSTRIKPATLFFVGILWQCNMHLAKSDFTSRPACETESETEL